MWVHLLLPQAPAHGKPEDLQSRGSYCCPLGQMENRQGEASAALGLESGRAGQSPASRPVPRSALLPVTVFSAAPVEGRGQGTGPWGLSRYLK